MLPKLLFRIAKSPLMGKIVGIAFQRCSWAIPVKKAYSSQEIIAFYHPQPSYENHIIISPKRAVQNLQQMAADGYSQYFAKVWEAAMDICGMHPEYQDAFVLVANGGKRQEVQQVHFHMFTHHEMVNEYTAQQQAESVAYRDSNICILEHPHPDWETHLVLKPISSSQATGTEYRYEYFRSVLRSIDLLNAEFQIVQRGYSLVCQYRKQKTDRECLVFHLISGKKRMSRAYH